MHLGELLDPNDLVDAIQVRDDIEPHLGALVLQLIEEQWQKVLDGAGGEKISVFQLLNDQ